MLLIGLVAACGDGGGFADAYVPPPQPHPGTFSMRWTLATPTAQPVTCIQANATKVEVGIAYEASDARFGQSFDCGLGDAVSGELAIGTYDLTFTLVGMAGTIATAIPQKGLVITSDMTTQTSTTAFVVPGT